MTHPPAVPNPDEIVDSSDDEVGKKKEEDKEDPPATTQPLSEALPLAASAKAAGNDAFKNDDLEGAMARYDEGVAALAGHAAAGDADVRALLLSLHSNRAMVSFKKSQWAHAVACCDAALRCEADNVKALFRRGASHAKLGALDEAKADLSRALSLDGSNAAAAKELAEVLKRLKERKENDKKAFSGAFSKSLYGDREAERKAKARREEEQRAKEQDEWTKSKLDRRSKGLEEQTFEEWKKERDAARKEEEEEAAAKAREQATPASEQKAKPKAAEEKAEEEDEEEYDAEEAAIIAETKKKGYCYFRSELSTEAKALVGDIRPKALSPGDLDTAHRPPLPPITSGGPTDAPLPGSSSEKVAASAWNTAGTFEERDVTALAKERLTALCLEASATSGGAAGGDMQALAAALDTLAPKAAVGAGEGGDPAEEVLAALEASLSTVRARVTAVKTITGDAQVVIARGKKRPIYDFAVTLDIEAVVEGLEGTKGEDGGGGDGKAKKVYKGKLITEVGVSDAPMEVVWSKSKPPLPSLLKTVNAVAEALKNEVREKVRLFEKEIRDW